ncbi:MAG: YkgJ family cysteine cluster protein, partial [Verrucomicrobiota bacterium]
MKTPRLEIPALQHWSCHGCSDCCRGSLLITVTPEEKSRIEKQNWTSADGIDPEDLIVEERGAFRLAHQPDGACVFLDAAGRCRLHAKFGEAAKPLACRLYPLVIHPAGKKLVVGLRFSCPSAVTNRGPALAGQSAEIQKLTQLVVPRDYREGPPPPVVAEAGEWPDFLRFVEWLDRSLAGEGIPVSLKLRRALHWLAAVEKGKLDQVTGHGADEILDALVKSAAVKIPAPARAEKPSRFGQLFLRTMVFEYARNPNRVEAAAAQDSPWKRLLGMFSFIRAGGKTPALRDGLAGVEFSAIEKP